MESRNRQQSSAGSGASPHARLASYRPAGGTSSNASLNVAPAPRPHRRTASQTDPQHAQRQQPQHVRHPQHAQRSQRNQRPQRPQRTNRAQYLNVAPSRNARTLRHSPANGKRPRRGTASRNAPWSPLKLIPIVLVVVLGIGIFSLVTSCNRRAAEQRAQDEAQAEAARIEAMRVHPEELGVTVAGFSTTKSQWRQGEMPHLYQTDPLWAYKPYAGGTVRANACGPTALTMVYVYLTGKTDYDPGSMAAFSDANNFAPTGATEWSFMTEGARMLGLQSRTISLNRSSIEQALAAGQPLICSVRPGDFTNVGHYIVIKSIDERGMLEV